MSLSISARVLLMWVMLLSKTSSSAWTCGNLSFCANNIASAVLCSFDVSSAFLVASQFWASFQSSALTLACCSCSVCCFSWVFLRVPFFLGRGSSIASWKCSSSSSLSSTLKCLSSSLNWSSNKEAMGLALLVGLSAFLGRLASMTWRGHGSSCTKNHLALKNAKTVNHQFDDWTGGEND